MPLFRQVANILKAERYAFSVFTPTGGVRLMSDRSADDFIELSLDTTGERPVVVGVISRNAAAAAALIENRSAPDPDRRPSAS